MTDLNCNSNNAHIDERELRYRRREEARRLRAQANLSISSSEDNITENQHRIQADDVMMNQAQDIKSNKPRSAVRPEEHHSVENQQIPNSEHLQHPRRDSNATAFSRTQLPKINFPPPNDTIWGSINDELASAIPRVFNSSIIKNMPIDKLSKKFDTWLHNFFVQRFGIKEVKEKSTHADDRPKRENRQLKWFRQRKKECRHAMRALKKAGLVDTPEGRLCSKTWKDLMRGHNKVRRQLALKQELRDRRRAMKEFRKNPNDFAKKLFNPPNTADPTFDQQTAQDYFSKTYRDECRENCYVPMDDQRRPPTPRVPFNVKDIELKELFRSVRRKRNNASPGFNVCTIQEMSSTDILHP